MLRNQVTDSGFTESKWTCTEFPVGSFLVFFGKSQIRHLRIPRIHGFLADSAKNGAPLSYARANPHPPPRAHGAFRLACSRHHGVEQANNRYRWPTLLAVNEQNNCWREALLA